MHLITRYLLLTVIRKSRSKPCQMPHDGKGVVMQALGRPEDLPEQYRPELTQQILMPLWPGLRSELPLNKPIPRTRHWLFPRRWIR